MSPNSSIPHTLYPIFRASRAESLMEVIIALAVIMIVAAPVSGLFIASRSASFLQRTDVIAAHLADEALEVVRNVRDTNLLRFSTKGADCWNTKPTQTLLQQCDRDVILGDRSYTFAVDLDLASPRYLQWKLEPQAAELHADLKGAQDSVYQLSLNSATGVYHHVLNGVNVAGEEPTQFYREVTIRYFDIAGLPGAVNPMQVDNVPDAMLIESRVRYRTGATVRTVSRAVVLTKYSR